MILNYFVTERSQKMGLTYDIIIEALITEGFQNYSTFFWLAMM